MIHLVQDANFKPTIYSTALATQMVKCGVPADFIPLGKSWDQDRYRQTISKHLLQSAYAVLQTRIFAGKALRLIQPKDVAVVYESVSITSNWLDCGFQRALLRKNVRYIPVFPDAWPVTFEWLRSRCRHRVALATAIGCVTPELVELFRTTFPGKRILLLEEPVPTDCFNPVWKTEGMPVVCWSGPPTKHKELVRMLPVLEAAARKIPFRLRIVSGLSRPTLKTTLPVEWMPFDESEHQSRFNGVDIAFASYEDNPFGRCKGNYKVKLYLAAGCAIVTSPVGYNLDLIRSGETGLFAQNRDEWEAAFLWLLEHPEERLAMRKAAREEAISRFSPEATAKKYAGVLASLGIE